MTETMKRVFDERFSVQAARPDVWRALTKPKALRAWFAEQVEVQLEPGGPYRFWGRHTPHYGGAEVSDQRITAVEPEALLAFTWTWGGAPSRCELRLTEAGPKETALHIHHELDGSILSFDANESCWLMRDFWTVAAGNLDEYVRTGHPALRPDFHDTQGDVELSIEIEAPAAEVWRTLTEPERIAGWLGMDPDLPGTPEVDLRVGGRYSFGWEQAGQPLGPQEILELDPERRLVYSWAHEGDATHRTEWTLEPLGQDRTRLTVRQVGTDGPREFCGYTNGWAGFLIALRREAARVRGDATMRG